MTVNIDGMIEVRRRQKRRRQQLLNELKEQKGCWKLKAAVIDRTVWRTRCGRGY